MKNKILCTFSIIFILLIISCGGGGGGDWDDAFTVSYDGNGATSGKIPAKQNSNDGSSLVISGNTGNLKINGYAFDGWNTAADGSGTDYVAGVSYKGKSITLYAKWSAIFITSTSQNSPSMIESISYVPNNSFLSIIGVTAKGRQLSEIEVPETIDGNDVISISSGAFTNCTNMVRLTIAPSIVNIGGNVFPGCHSLESVEFTSPTPPSIGVGAFDGCTARLLVSYAYVDIYKGVAGWIDYASRIAALDTDIFTFEVSNYKAIITGLTEYGKTLTSLAIPNHIGGYTVTEIGDLAFNDCSYLTGSLTIPSSITNIGHHAFCECKFTGSLYIPSSVTNIGDYAFYNCNGFTGDLTIPSKVTSIKEGAFSGCSGFTGILTLPSNVTSIGDFAFSGDNFTGNLVLPSGVMSIGTYAFGDCLGFTGSLILPSTLISIGGSAFNRCSGFTGDLSIPSSITSIGDFAFWGCSGLTSISVYKNTPPALGNNAFINCNNLNNILVPNSAVATYKGASGWSEYAALIESSNGIPNEIFTYVISNNEITITGLTDYGRERRTIIIPESINGYPVTSIGDNAFYQCSGFIGNLTIPSSVTSIGNYAFYRCSGFAGDLIIPPNVITIGNHSFDYCSGFTGNLVIPSSVTSIGDYAFVGCSGLTGNLTIGSNVTTIGGSAFQGCGFTGGLTIPSSVTRIGHGAFYGCSGFTGSLTIPSSVTAIGGSAFYQCSGFTGSPTISSNVTVIEGSTFYGCSGFTGVLNIPSSVTSIGANAFKNCTGFTGTLILPSGLISIGESAFSGCTGFTGSLTLPSSVTSIGEWAFNQCSGFTGNLTILSNVMEIKNNTFSGCSFAGTLTIPSSVIIIGSAFYNCGFTKIKVENTTPPSLSYNNIFASCTNLNNILVPNSAVATYKGASGWSTYAGIISGY